MSSPSAYHLFPSAIVCSCGKRFDSDWSGSASLHRLRLPSVGSALWLFLRHRSARLAARGSTKRPHCAAAVMYQCLYCQNSIDISDYRQHLLDGDCCQDADPAEASAMLAHTMQLLGDAAKSQIPLFDCYQCEPDDECKQLDLGGVLEHTHFSFFETRIRCRECRLRVPLCDAVGHAAYWHSDRLRSPTALADLFVTIPSTWLSQCVSSSSAPIGWEIRAIEQSDAPDQVETYGPLLEPCDSSPSGSVCLSNTVSQVTDSIAESTTTTPVVINFSECQVCGATFDSSSEMLSHARKHAPPRRFRCRECGKSFVFAFELHYHIRRAHVRGRRHECDECGMRFFAKCELTVHMRLHTGERPYRCDICELTYRSKAALRTHVNRLRGVVGHVLIKPLRRPYVRKPPKLLPCDQCGKLLKGKQSLKHHVFRHTGARPFRCPLCDKGLSNQYSLKDHMLYHAKVRSFRCDVCDDKAFITLDTLRQHQGTRAHKAKESERQRSNATYEVPTESVAAAVPP